MWRLCALCALLVAAVPVLSSVCDNGQLNIQLDLPKESVYLCPRDYRLPSRQVYPSIATKYEAEETFHACMDVVINHTARIPNSGAHRPIRAKYGEYIYCPPQRWVHNLQHSGVVFLYHPCVGSEVKKALSLVARSCIPRHIITPFPGLSRKRPLAVVTWCSTLEMSHINVTEISNWLKANVHYKPLHQTADETYNHLLIQPSSVSTHDINPCDERDFQVLNNFLSRRGRSDWRLLRKRRAVSSASPVVEDMASAHSSDTSPNTHVNLIDMPTKKSTFTPAPGTNAMASVTISSDSHLQDIKASKVESITSDSQIQDIKASVKSRETESITPDLHIQDIKASANSKKTESNHQVNKLLPKTTSGNQTLFLPHVNVTQLVTNASEETGENQPLQPKVTQTQPPDSSHKETPIHVESGTDAAEQSHKITPPKLSPSVDKMPSGGHKQECSCPHDTTELASHESLAKAQKRVINSEGFIATPRTEEATWAAASLIFLLSLLTFSVLYTQIYKKFQRSQSLYWTSESHSEDKETVASIIKRRLVQGHSKRKKWFGRKKSPTVLYESLSESSE